ncbi:MAG: hypothetical protein JST49_11795 [Bacteroidetes bacterium]|nr:hypothetical protein [Bacteroidota bacterium]
MRKSIIQITLNILLRIGIIAPWARNKAYNLLLAKLALQLKKHESANKVEAPPKKEIAKLKRAQIEKGIVKQLTAKLNTYGYKYIENKKGVSNTYYLFELESNGFVYRQQLRFIKPNFLQYDSLVTISSPQLSNETKRIDPTYSVTRYYSAWEDNETEDFSICEIEMNHYCHPDNKEARKSFMWNRMKSLSVPITELVSEDDLSKISEEVYAIFFKPVLEEIVPATNSLSKIDAILNNLPQLSEADAEIPPLSICSPYSQQLVFGLILANYLNRSDKSLISAKYKAEADKYDEDSYGYIDLLHKAYSFYGN